MNQKVLDIKPLIDASFARFASVRMRGLSQPDQVLVCVWALLGEVGNGGFDQWLFNTSGDWTRETFKALEILGANEAADLVRRAIALFPNRAPSSELETRRLQMEVFTEAHKEELSVLDNSFFQIDGAIEALLYEYAQAHRAEVLP